jgi:hypothetical protein
LAHCFGPESEECPKTGEIQKGPSRRSGEGARVTTQLQIELARKIAEEIAKMVKGIRSTSVDDWDDNGSFNLFAFLKCRDNPLTTAGGQYLFQLEDLRGLLTRIKTIIKTLGAEFEWAEPPRQCYHQMDGRKFFEGYDRDNYKLSIRIP